jgi:hypothetical protein
LEKALEAIVRRDLVCEKGEEERRRRKKRKKKKRGNKKVYLAEGR